MPLDPNNPNLSQAQKNPDINNASPAQLQAFYQSKGFPTAEQLGATPEEYAEYVNNQYLVDSQQIPLDDPRAYGHGALFTGTHGNSTGGPGERTDFFTEFGGYLNQTNAQSPVADVGGFHPGTTHYDANGKLIYDTENNPGVSLDPAAYQNSPELDEYRARADDMYANNVGLDPTRFDASGRNVVASEGGQDGVYWAEQALKHPDIYGQSVELDQSGSNNALGTAKIYNDQANQNQYQIEAGKKLEYAASGAAPSAAEYMAQRAGVDSQAAYRQAGSDAQYRARVGGDAALAAQYALAAGARGGQSGLALIQAQNNAAQAQAALYGQAFDQAGTAQRAAIQAGQQGQLGASQVRADEMATARQQFAGFGSDVRSQDLSRAGQAASLAGYALTQEQQDAAVSQFNSQQTADMRAKNLDVRMNNAQSINQLSYAADEAQAARNMQAQLANQANDQAIELANQNTATNRYTQDQQLAAGALASGTQQATNAQANQILYEKDYGDTIQSNATRAANERSGVATMAENKRQFDANRIDNMVGTAVGTAGAVIGTLATSGGAAASDERTKNITGHRDPYDFSSAEDYVYTYKPSYQGKLPGADSREHIGPMAQDLPDDVQYTQDGKRVVDLGRLALRIVPAVGELQRKQKQLEARK